MRSTTLGTPLTSVLDFRKAVINIYYNKLFIAINSVKGFIQEEPQEFFLLTFKVYSCCNSSYGIINQSALRKRKQSD